MTTTTDDVTHLRALLAEQTSRAERAESYVSKLKIDVSGFKGTIGEQVDRIHAEMARAEKAEADYRRLLSERAEANQLAGRCAHQRDVALVEVGRLRECVDAAIEGRAEVFFAVEDRERLEAERDAALAACAELRAAAVGVDGRCRLCTARPREHRDNCALSRPDLGRGWASPEDTAQMVGALQMVEGDGEFDSLHEVTRKFVVDVLALLKKGGG